MSGTNQNTSTPPLLDASDLTVVKNGHAILSEASVRLERSEFTVVIGPNGAGKSTLLKCLSGEIQPDTGTVLIKGKPLAEWNSTTLAQQRAVLAQQTPLAFPFLVYEVVALGRLAHREQSDAERDARAVTDALDRLDLAHLATRRYTTLSGGEQQRTQLARVLTQLNIDAQERTSAGANLLLLDEPISALDIRHQCKILSIVRQLANQGDCVFAVLHDLNFALRFADRVILMRDGRIWHDVHATDCKPEMLEDIFEISLTQIPDTQNSGPNFFFPRAPKKHLQTQ